LRELGGNKKERGEPQEHWGKRRIFFDQTKQEKNNRKKKKRIKLKGEKRELHSRRATTVMGKTGGVERRISHRPGSGAQGG